MTRLPRADFTMGSRALILHRPHATVAAIERQLHAIGFQSASIWPEIGPGHDADVIFFDVDMGFDAQFPWAPGTSPVPLIALIGSEAPGRIEWSLTTGAHAQLLKPVGDGGVYSALLIAGAAFARQGRMATCIGELQGRIDARGTLVRAVLHLMSEGMDQEAAFACLRRMATDARETVEDAAARIIARPAAVARKGSTR